MKELIDVEIIGAFNVYFSVILCIRRRVKFSRKGEIYIRSTRKTEKEIEEGYERVEGF